MGQGPLVTEQIEARARFLHAFDHYAKVKVAGWLKELHSGRWYLYVVSDQIDDSNFDVAYREVANLAQKTQDPWLDAFKVKLLAKDDKTACALFALSKQHAGRQPGWHDGKRLGEVFVEDVYLYPPLAAVAC